MSLGPRRQMFCCWCSAGDVAGIGWFGDDTLGSATFTARRKLLLYQVPTIRRHSSCGAGGWWRCWHVTFRRAERRASIRGRTALRLSLISGSRESGAKKFCWRSV
jgi:hypothetical protein